MSTIWKTLGGLVVLLAWTAATAQAQVVGAGGYNPYTGYGGRAGAAYNPYTGTSAAGRTGYNPYTGTRAQSRTAYNPYTGASASVKGYANSAPFAMGKFALRGLAQSMARELAPKNIHVAHLVIDSGVDTAFVRERIRQHAGDEALANLQPDQLMNPASIAETYWQLYRQPRDAWTFELDVRPYRETW